MLRRRAGQIVSNIKIDAQMMIVFLNKKSKTWVIGLIGSNKPN